MKVFKRFFILFTAILMTVAAVTGCADKKAQSDPPSKENGSSFDEKCLDPSGQLTLYALTELTGPEIVALLEEQGYEWERKDETLKRFKKSVALPDGSVPQIVTFSASDGIYEDVWELEDYENASNKGGAAAMKTDFIVAGYGDPTGEKVIWDDVISAVVNVEIVDRAFRDDLDAAMLIVRDSSGKEYAVMLQVTGPARTEIETFTDEVLATCSPASSLADEWTAFSGEKTYGEGK